MISQRIHETGKKKVLVVTMKTVALKKATLLVRSESWSEILVP